MKRTLSLVLVLLLSLSLLVGCAVDAPASQAPADAPVPEAPGAEAPAADPAAEEELVLNMDELYTVEVFSMTANYAGIQPGWFGKVLKDKFNMEHNIIATNLEGGDSKLATKMASGNLGDIVIFGDSSGNDMANAIEAGLLVDWNENGLVQKFGPTFIEEFPDALKYNSIMYGGGDKVYGIGYNVSYDSEGPSEGNDLIWGPYIRWDLYAELGYPKVTCLEDFLPILKQMQEMCPTSDTGKPTYGFSMWGDWDGTHMMFAKQYGAMNGYNDGDTGNLMLINGAEPKYQSFLEKDGYYHKCLRLFFDANQMGLVDPDSISQKNADVTAKINDGQVLFSFFSWVSGYNTPEHTDAGKGMYAIPFEGEKVYSYSQSTYGGNRTTCIGSTAKDPVRIMDFLNWAYTDEGTMVYSNGPEGMCWEYDENGQPFLNEFGLEVYNDSTTVVPDEFGGGQYNDGEPKFSPGTLTKTTISKKSGLPFDRAMWPSTLDHFSNPALDAWREYMGVRTPKEYFEKNDLLSIYKVPLMEGGARVMNPDLEQIKSTIGAVVKEYSWRMVFAKDEAEFNSLWDEMVAKAEGLGLDQLNEWVIEGIELEFAAREKGLN